MADEFNLVFPLFDDVTQLDFAGPAQFLSRIPSAQMHVVTKDGNPVTTDCGFSIMPTGSFADCPQADLICVPGGFGTAQAMQDEAMIDFLKGQAKNAQWLTSVCTGSFVLGAVGLLAGKRATSHWAYTHLLENFGATYEAARVVRDGNIITAGGVTSGIDFGLEVISAVAGEEVAKMIQLSLEYDPAPPFDCGHPDKADKATISAMRDLFYDSAAAGLEAAIEKSSVLPKK